MSDGQAIPDAEVNLSVENVIDRDSCHYVLNYSRGVKPQKILVNCKPHGMQELLLFRGADREVTIPHQEIGPNGSFDGLVRTCQQKEENGEAGVNFILLASAEFLTIRSNSQAVHALSRYIRGEYKLDRRWQYQELSRDMQIEIYESCGDLQPLKEIVEHFNYVTVNGEPARDYLLSYETNLQTHNIQHNLKMGPLENSVEATEKTVLGGETPVNHVTGCDKTIQRLTVQQQLKQERVIVFYGPRPLVATEIRIEENGCLQCVLYCYWFDGVNGGRFSPLSSAQVLYIMYNSVALWDLEEYVRGQFRLPENWIWQRLNEEMKPVISCVAKDVPIVMALKGYFKNTTIHELREQLKEENKVEYECNTYIFTECRNMAPRSLTVSANVNEIVFLDADDKVCISNITIRLRGDLMAVLQNSYGNSTANNYYALLQHAKVLTIVGNSEAVKDLADCVSERYKTDNAEYGTEILNEEMQIIISNVNDREEEINILKGYFNTVVEDGGGMHQLRE